MNAIGVAVAGGPGVAGGRVGRGVGGPAAGGHGPRGRNFSTRAGIWSAT